MIGFEDNAVYFIIYCSILYLYLYTDPCPEEVREKENAESHDNANGTVHAPIIIEVDKGMLWAFSQYKVFDS